MIKTAVAYSLVVLLSALLGYSLTRTPGLRTASPVLFALVGAGVACIALLVYHATRRRIALSLPPSDHLRGLKVFMVGFLVGLCGWFVAVFVSVEAGAPIGLVGFAIGAAGMLYHFYLWANRE